MKKGSKGVKIMSILFIIFSIIGVITIGVEIAGLGAPQFPEVQRPGK